MSKPKTKLEENEQLAEQPAAPGPVDEAVQETAAPDPEDIPDEAPGEAIEDPAEQRVAELEAAVADLKDQLLRALAEVENVRRRSQKERDDARKYAAAPLLKDLLVVSDNLSRAIEATPDDDDPGDERLATLLDGVKLTERELATVFERHHIVKVEPLGEPLDPHRHEALFEVPDPSQPNGTVVQVIQPGYLLHDRLLRPARVGVAKGGPAASSGAAKPAGDEPSNDAPDPGAHVDTSA